MIPSLPNSEDGRLRRDGNTVPNQTQHSSKQQVSDSSWRKQDFHLKNTKTSPVLGNKELNGLYYRSSKSKKSPRFQSFVNENENLSKVCQASHLLEKKIRQAFEACQTCQTCRFRNLVVSQTQIPSLPSLPFSELAPIKHTLNRLVSAR